MSSPILEARELHKTYHLGQVDVPVLAGCSFTINAGEFVAVLGSSGSGKSTLLHLLGGLDRPDPDSGDILHNGESLSTYTASRLDRYRAETVGFVFQFYHLLPELNVLENTLLPGMVGSGIRADEDRARELLHDRDRIERQIVVVLCEPVGDRIEDPWKVLECTPSPTGCVALFEDPEFATSADDVLYYVRAIEEPTPAVDADPLNCTRDAAGRCVEMDPCYGRPSDDECLADTEQRAWSSPIFVDHARQSTASR